jgi:hypothetical protein
MNKARLLIWTALMVSAALALPFVFLIVLLMSTSSGDSSTGMSSIRAVLFVALAGLFALPFIIVGRAIRRLAWRWHSPMFYPAISTLVTGFFAAGIVLFMFGRPWEARDLECDRYGTCTTSSRIEVHWLGITLFLAVFIFGPFLISVRQLYSAWRIPPTRFVYRRRRH